MGSKVPILKQIAWISIVPHLCVFAVAVSLSNHLHAEDPVFTGSLTFVALLFILRALIPKDHRKAIRLVKQGKLSEAIPYFQKSYDFFTKYRWLDKYRYITILSASKACYKEMALNSIAFCYGQIGDAIKAKAYYEQSLKEFPGNIIATTALRLIDTFSRPETSKN